MAISPSRQYEAVVIKIEVASSHIQEAGNFGLILYCVYLLKKALTLLYHEFLEVRASVFASIVSSPTPGTFLYLQYWIELMPGPKEKTA